MCLNKIIKRKKLPTNENHCLKIILFSKNFLDYLTKETRKEIEFDINMNINQIYDDNGT